MKPMALLTVWGETGCRPEETARLTARELGWDLLTSHRLEQHITQEFGADAAANPQARRTLLAHFAAELGQSSHLVIATPDAARLRDLLSPLFTVHITAPLAHRVGALMLEHRLDRPAAHERLRSLEAATRRPPLAAFDLICNLQQLATEQAANVIACAVQSAGLADRGFVTAAPATQLQMRLQFSRFGLPSPSSTSAASRAFANSSEQVFADLLNFYRIAWEYEARSFPLRWDKEGRVTEAFTPDFYLPEFQLYVELTTMKQANVTRKNRKVRQLKSLYPDVNIQVFYLKDVQDLAFKFGLSTPLAAV